MPPQVNKRMPSSCEPCRGRKIRCYGTDIPCDTCVRRGRAAGCFYRGDFSRKSTIVQQNGQGLRHVDTSDMSNSELAQRVTRLEKLMHQHIQSSPTNTASSTSTIPQRQSQTTTSPRSGSDGGSPLGSLVTTASGHVRYMPASLQWLEAGTVEQSAEHGVESGAISPTARMPNSQFGDLNMFLGVGGESAATKQELLDLLPPLIHCDKLKDIFLSVFSPLLHILHEPTFNDRYTLFRNDASQTPLSFLALLFVIFATAVTTLDDENALLSDLGHGSSSPTAKVHHLTAKYQSTAIKALTADHFMWQHNLDTVKSLILLIYSISHTRGPAWSFLGTAVNIAMAIGCHIDPAYLRPCSFVEAEERRRCWHVLSMLQTIQSASIGVPCLSMASCQVKLPADMEDEDFDHAATFGEPPALADGQPTSKMTYILNKIYLYDLAAKICRLPSSVSAEQHSQLHEYAGQISNSIAKQDQAFSDMVSLPVYHQAQKYILQIYSNHLLLIIYRSCLVEQDNGGCRKSSTSTSSRDVHGDSGADSARFCIVHAINSITAFNCLCSRDEMKPYVWYTQRLGAFYALLAVVVIPVALNSSQTANLPPWSSIQRELLLLCRNFQKFSHRSELCMRGYRLTSRLLQTSPLVSETNELYGTVSGHDTMDNDEEPSHQLISPPLFMDDIGYTRPMQGAASLETLAEQSAILNFVSHSPNQQWLSPATFDWDQWQFV